MLDAAKNHFELFGLPTSFALDAKQLAERYRALVSASQAKRFASDMDPETTDAPPLARVEEAYRVLMDPLARAKYLLSLEHSTQAWPATNALCSGGELLMEQMELLQTLAEASSRSNPAMAVANILTELAEQSALLGKELQTLFAEPSPKNLSAAREIVRQLEFISRCRRDAEHRRAELEVQG